MATDKELEEALADAEYHRVMADAAEKKLQAIRDVLTGEPRDGPCYYCGEQTNVFSGNPGNWPLWFPHEDDPGVVKAHHVQCVRVRLKP